MGSNQPAGLAWCGLSMKRCSRVLSTDLSQQLCSGGSLVFHGSGCRASGSNGFIGNCDQML